MNSTLPEPNVYPTNLMLALDRIMDALPFDEAAVAEDRIMGALHAHARGNSGPLMEAAADYPLLGEALGLVAA